MLSYSIFTLKIFFNKMFLRHGNTIADILLNDRNETYTSHLYFLRFHALELRSACVHSQPFGFQHFICFFQMLWSVSFIRKKLKNYKEKHEDTLQTDVLGVHSDFY